MKPLERMYLHQDGDDEDRIGSFSRNSHYTNTQEMESLIDQLCPLSVTCDVRMIHPPYFTEFCYVDVLGGLSLHTLSAEITCRVMEQAVQQAAVRTFDLSKAMDKYSLKVAGTTPKKVVFLAGNNASHFLDQSKLQWLMQDEDWYIKPHPVTNDGMIRDLAKIYGYGRLIDSSVSGITLLKNAEEVACMQTSELYILARYIDKSVIDVTRFDRAWLTTYHHVIRLMENTPHDKEIITRCFGSPLSGHIRNDFGYAANSEIITAYYDACLKEREKFKLITNQRLAVEDKTIVDWL